MFGDNPSQCWLTYKIRQAVGVTGDELKQRILRIMAKMSYERVSTVRKILLAGVALAVMSLSLAGRAPYGTAGARTG